MESNSNFKSEIFKRAWIMFYESGKKFSECLRKAWKVFKLKKTMTKKVVKFTYKKVNGSIRFAKGTLQEVFLREVKGDRKPNLRTLAYWDMEAQGFRCFRIENLIKLL
ncbi:MAG: SH3 beta-barrel fold-containing protein [Bacteroidota bacterium]